MFSDFIYAVNKSSSKHIPMKNYLILTTSYVSSVVQFKLMTWFQGMGMGEDRAGTTLCGIGSQYALFIFFILTGRVRFFN